MSGQADKYKYIYTRHRMDTIEWKKIAPHCFACGIVVFTAICSVSLEVREREVKEKQCVNRRGCFE